MAAADLTEAIIHLVAAALVATFQIRLPIEVVVAGEIELAFSEPELAALADRGRASGEMTVRRYRGLAAVDPAMLHETCVATATRRTARVSSADVASMIEVVEALEPESPGPAA